MCITCWHGCSPEVGLSTSVFAENGADFFNVLLKILIFLEHFRDFLVRMDDGRMVPSSEFIADFRQRELGHFPGKVHGDLSWESDGLGTLFSSKIFKPDAEVLTDGFLNVEDRDLARPGIRDDILERFFG